MAGILSTPSQNSIVTDSAPSAACSSTGNKSNHGQEGVFPDDTADKWDKPRVEPMGNCLQPNVNPVTRDLAGDFFIVCQVIVCHAAGPGVQSAVHTAADIPLSAGGPGSELLGGTMDNTSVFFRVMQAALGGSKAKNEKGKDDDDRDDD